MLIFTVNKLLPAFAGVPTVREREREKHLLNTLSNHLQTFKANKSTSKRSLFDQSTEHNHVICRQSTRHKLSTIIHLLYTVPS